MSDSPAVRAAVTRALTRAQQDHMRALVHRRVVERPAGNRLLFLAPHPDDIVIGCGGALLRCLHAGARVRLAYLTDGRAVAEQADEEEMRQVRADEARAVACHLRLPDPILLDWNERTFTSPQHQDTLVGRLADVLTGEQPDAVFVPYFFDQHADHRYSNALLARALEQTGQQPRIYGYEVWSQVPPALVVDISAQLSGKLELVRLYASQVALLDYPTLVQTLATLHAPLVGPDCTAAEVYATWEAADYLRTVQALDLTSAVSLEVGVLLTPPE